MGNFFLTKIFYPSCDCSKRSARHGDHFEVCMLGYPPPPPPEVRGLVPTPPPPPRTPAADRPTHLPPPSRPQKFSHPAGGQYLNRPKQGKQDAQRVSACWQTNVP